VAAVLLVAVLVGVGALVFLGRSDDVRDAARTSSVDRQEAAPEQVPPGPEIGDVVPVEGITYTLRAVHVDGTCVGHAYGEVANFFSGTDCTGLSRALYSTDVDGRPVVVSVSRVQMADTATARSLQALADRNGSGNVSDLLREGVTYPGAPDRLSDAEYASAVSGSSVTIVEAAWSDPANAGDAADVDLVAGAALVLEVAPLPQD